MRKITLFCITIMFLSAWAYAQSPGYVARAKKYIDQYATLAILEQKKSGIPASITLGQGILETEAGASELMTEANNHFGIKCKNGWQGPYYKHDDDAPNEHFKKYTCAAESYSDHSALLLNNPRYAPLLVLPQTDYAAWAKCLRKCGYATSPTYAEQLIKIIEDFKLQDYTYTALDSSLRQDQLAESEQEIKVMQVRDTAEKPGPFNTAPIAPATSNSLAQIADSAKKAIMPPANIVTQPITKQVARTDTTIMTIGLPVASVAKPIAKSHTDTLKINRPKPVAVPTAAATTNAVPVAKAEKKPVNENHIVMVNGLQAFFAYKDELILQYAMKYHKTYQQLLMINDLQDGPIPFNMYVYLEHKLTKGVNARHEVKEGESLLMVAQEEGIQLKSLRELNLLNPNEEPIPGTILELQNPALQKPVVNVSELTAHNRNSIVVNEEQVAQTSSDYIEIPKPKPAATNTESKTTKTTGKIEPDPQFEAFLDSMSNALDHKNAAPKAAPAKPAPAQMNAAGKQEKFYTVKRGDTAFGIAKSNNITLDQLMKWNKMDGHITIGQNLQVKE